MVWDAQQLSNGKSTDRVWNEQQNPRAPWSVLLCGLHPLSTAGKVVLTAMAEAGWESHQAVVAVRRGLQLCRAQEHLAGSERRLPHAKGPWPSWELCSGTGHSLAHRALLWGCGSGWGHREELGTLQVLLMPPCLLCFALCVFPGMYSGSSSSSHSGPSPAVLPAPHDIPRHLPLDPALPSPHHHQSPLESARDGYVCPVRVLGLLGLHLIMEDCIVYFTLHGCCSKENTGPNKAVLFGLESWNNFVFKGPQKVVSSMPCAEQGKLGHHYQVVQGLVLAFDKTQWDFFLHNMQLHLDSNFVF